MAGRRTSLAALAGQKVEDVPGRGDPTLIRIPLAKVVPTPLNPRTDFGSREELADLGNSLARQQLHPIVLVSRMPYLKLFPEHAEQVGQVPYVIANGERRYRGALEAGLGSIEAVIREDVASSRTGFLDAVLSENIDRKNFDPIEEAQAMEAMVREFGSARAVAEHRGKHETWVSQRRSLLRLAPAAQALVRQRKMPVEAARRLAKAVKDRGLGEQAQLEWWDTERGRQQLERKLRAVPPAPQEPAVVVPAPASAQPAGLTPHAFGDLAAPLAPEAPRPVGEQGLGPRHLERVPAPAPEPTESATVPPQASPVTRPASTGRHRRDTGALEELPPLQLVEAMPWGNPREVLRIAREHMRPEDFETLIREGMRLL